MRPPHPKRKTCKCGRQFRSDKSEDCAYCRAKTRDPKTGYECAKKFDPVQPRRWQQTTDTDTIQDIRFLAAKLIDMGDSGPVRIYRAGQPEFEALKRQYGSL